MLKTLLAHFSENKMDWVVFALNWITIVPNYHLFYDVSIRFSADPLIRYY